MKFLLLTFTIYYVLAHLGFLVDCKELSPTKENNGTMARYYVSITGLEIKSLFHYPEFWTHAISSFSAAQSSPGNVHAMTKGIRGIQHTVTVWDSRESMLKFLRSGAHLGAMKVSKRVGSYGKVYGYESDSIPSMDEARKIWEEKGRVVLGKPREGDLGGPHHAFETKKDATTSTVA